MIFTYALKIIQVSEITSSRTIMADVFVHCHIFYFLIRVYYVYCICIWYIRSKINASKNDLILCLSHFSRLGRAPEAEDLASQMLKGFPRDRVSAQDALVHNYFSVLPAQLHQLPDGE